MDNSARVGGTLLNQMMPGMGLGGHHSMRSNLAPFCMLHDGQATTRLSGSFDPPLHRANT